MQQLDAESQEDAEKSKVEEWVESVAEMAEAVVETVEQVAESQEDTDKRFEKQAAR